ncbi:MAG: carboxyl transferase [Lachnospiraceae bacterium]|nr:carboxyl transferase [Lachnospiraceae bacterium]
MSNMAEKSALSRIEAFVDENSFVQIGGQVSARTTDFNMQDKETPADGVVTGYGVVDGNLVFVYSQDATVLGGAIGEMHAKKIVRLYDMAMKMGAPIVGLIDCAGLRLQEATDALNGFGEIYGKMALASGVIPQITAVFGNCGGGLGVLAELSDFTLMSNEGKLFVNAPNTLDGNKVDKCDTASADYQWSQTGLADMIGSETEVLASLRNLVAILPSNNEEDGAYSECVDSLNRICENIEGFKEDTLNALAIISDSGLVTEIKSGYAKEMVTAFIKLNGMTVGAVANRSKAYDAEGNCEDISDGTLTTAGCYKATEFVAFCDAFNIPVVTLTNVLGFKATVDEEKTIAKAAAKLTYTFANANVPKVNVVVGDAFGSAYSVMNSKATGCDMVFAWPLAKIGTMCPKEAARIIYAEELKNAEDKNAFIDEKAAEYDALQTSALSAAKRGYIDSIIEPCDTRKYVIGALEMLYTKREGRPDKKHGTV